MQCTQTGIVTVSHTQRSHNQLSQLTELTQTDTVTVTHREEESHNQLSQSTELTQTGIVTVTHTEKSQPALPVNRTDTDWHSHSETHTEKSTNCPSQQN